jgi:hypothetical protein
MRKHGRSRPELVPTCRELHPETVHAWCGACLVNAREELAQLQRRVDEIEGMLEEVETERRSHGR